MYRGPRLLAAALAAFLAVPVAAQTPTPEITAAVAPLPEGLRAGAEVRGWRDGGLVVLRPGSNGMICLADDPSDDRFHAACYHEALEPFMERGRQLTAQGLDRAAKDSIRLAEADAGTLAVPTMPAALYSLTGRADAFDPATGAVTGARPLYVLYMPYMTAEATGLSPVAGESRPWIMFPGKASAHIMIVPPRP
jgi:hypothetical protein